MNDNEMLREIIRKSKARANAKLTNEEKSCMRRHDIVRRDGRLYSGVNLWYDIGRVPYGGSLDKIDLVDRAHKAFDREFSHMVNSTYYGRGFGKKFKRWQNVQYTRKYDKYTRLVWEKNYYGDKCANVVNDYNERIAKLMSERDESKAMYDKMYAEACKNIDETLGRTA